MTHNGHIFQNKLTDAERDELLFQMVEQLNTVNLRLGEVETSEFAIERSWNKDQSEWGKVECNS